MQSSILWRLMEWCPCCVQVYVSMLWRCHACNGGVHIVEVPMMERCLYSEGVHN